MLMAAGKLPRMTSLSRHMHSLKRVFRFRFLLLFFLALEILFLIALSLPRWGLVPVNQQPPMTTMPSPALEALESDRLAPKSSNVTTLEAITTIVPAHGHYPYYGHYPYEEVAPEKLMIISSYGFGQYQRFEYMEETAARALMKMLHAARDQKVWIIPASGFRNFEIQNELFQNQIDRQGSIEAASLISAPPGYSEHHTGFAIDLADGNYPNQDITSEFAKTEAFFWLSEHAIDYGFEMSFPENNSQGINYEPWHWRYIGSPEAQHTFARARQ